LFYYVDIIREVPVRDLPDLEQMRRLVRLRHAALQETMPLARLSEAQNEVAQAHGFADWAALKEELGRRAMTTFHNHVRPRRALPSSGHRLDQAREPLRVGETLQPFNSGFLRSGMGASAGFLLALAGILLVLFAWQYHGMDGAMRAVLAAL
jgi:hypothetical protein